MQSVKINFASECLISACSLRKQLVHIGQFKLISVSSDTYTILCFIIFISLYLFFYALLLLFLSFSLVSCCIALPYFLMYY